MKNQAFKNEVQEDLFFIYLKNHLNAFKSVVLYFLLLVLMTYTFDRAAFQYFLRDGTFYFSGLIFFLYQYYLYFILIKGKKFSKKILKGLIANKILYSVIFLLFIFYPIHVDTSYAHIVSFFVIFMAMVRFISASSVFLPLFLTEMAIYGLFPVFIFLINYKVGDNSYIIFMSILATTFFMVHAGIKNYRLSRDLVLKSYELKGAVDRAEDANKAKTEFLAAMSHEIRTPLSGIMGMINFLQSSEMKQDQKECLDIIDSCSKALLNTLNDILDVSKMEAGKFTIDQVNFDIYHLVRNIYKLMQPKAVSKKLDFALNIRDDVPKYILADPNRIQQIVINLVNNALKFTEKGSIHIDVFMKHSPAEIIRFEIHDSGIGIDEAGQAKLFQNFSQVDGSISRKFGGTGLGLSIARQLVELMGGTIGVTSVLGHGSNFWFEIPCVPAEDLAEAKDSTFKIVSVEGIKILVAEDNHVNQLIVKRLLDQAGLQYEIAKNGVEAVTKAMEYDYDLILMDMQMPEKDGIEATREIRQMGEKYQNIPVIGLTANTLEDQIQKCLDAGMVDHISKPIDPDILYRKIAEYVPALRTAAERKIAVMAEDSRAPHLQELRKTMGDTYVVEFVGKARDEMRRILASMDTAFAQQDGKAVLAGLHDLKSISGSIDRDDILSTVQEMQDLFKKKSYTQAGAGLTKLREMMDTP